VKLASRRSLRSIRTRTPTTIASMLLVRVLATVPGLQMNIGSFLSGSSRFPVLATTGAISACPSQVCVECAPVISRLCSVPVSTSSVVGLDECDWYCCVVCLCFFSSLFLHSLLSTSSLHRHHRIALLGRVGYQCSNYYRKLLRSGELTDPNYVIENGKEKWIGKKSGQLPCEIARLLCFFFFVMLLFFSLFSLFLCSFSYAW
jgi:hypothetical protein